MTSISATPPAVAEDQNKRARIEAAKRIQRLTYYYTEEYVKELDNRKQEIAAEKAMKEAAGDSSNEIKCLVLTAEHNAEVMMGCITDCIHAVNLLADMEQDIDDWMAAGITAMLDKVNEGRVFPFDLPMSICGLLCAQFR